MKRCTRKNLANALLPIFCLLVGAGLITLSVYACIGVSFFPILFMLFLPFAQPRSYNLLDGMDKWRTDLYHLRRFLSIITIDFNEEALREIAETSGRDIPECWSNAQRREKAYRQMRREE